MPTMQARMRNIAIMVPDALRALYALKASGARRCGHRYPV